MCEYCGCQAVEAIAVLTAEHEAVVNLVGRADAAVAAGDVEDARRQALAIARVLVPHTVVEEEGLFPALARDFPEHVDHLVAEHREIEAILGEGAGERPGPDWPSRLTRALHLLRLHILAEQDGAFPAALGALDPADWEAVDAVRARVGRRDGAAASERG
jgi:hypothetical protein